MQRIFAIVVMLLMTTAVRAQEGAYKIFVPPGRCSGFVATCPRAVTPIGEGGGGGERRRLRYFPDTKFRQLDDDDEEPPIGGGGEATRSPINPGTPGGNPNQPNINVPAAAVEYIESYGGVTRIALCLQTKLPQFVNQECGREIKAEYNLNYPNGNPEDPSYISNPAGPLTVKELDAVLLIVKEEVDPEPASDGTTIVMLLGGATAIGGAAFLVSRRNSSGGSHQSGHMMHSSISGVGAPQAGSLGPFSSAGGMPGAPLANASNYQSDQRHMTPVQEAEYVDMKPQNQGGFSRFANSVRDSFYSIAFVHK